MKIWTNLFVYLFSGFRGQHCEENIDDCIGNLCQNGATCVDRVNEYACLCPPTFRGPQCETDVDECSVRPSICHNGGTCTNSHGSYSCICVNGWTGADCSINIDDCNAAACFNGATCIDRVGSFYCQCTPGKTGTILLIISLNLASKYLISSFTTQKIDYTKSSTRWRAAWNGGDLNYISAGNSNFSK